jgi:uncharacterized delta-60 repeat protein
MQSCGASFIYCLFFTNQNFAMRKIFYTLFLFFVASQVIQAQSGFDPSFGSSGFVITNFGFGLTYDDARQIAVQPDGKILVAGGGLPDAKLARYNTDGSFDNSFGTGGKWSAPIIQNNTLELITDMKLLSDGRITVAGVGQKTTVNGPVNYAFVARFLATGSPDPSFHTYQENMFTDNTCHIAIASTGNIIMVTAGSFQLNTPGTGITGLLNDGTYNYGFGGGIFGIQADASYLGNDVLILPGDEFMICGSYTATSQVAVAKYNAAGIKVGFTQNVVFTGGGPESAFAMALQSDSKVVVVATSNDDFAVCRFSPDGILDNSFLGTGKVSTDLGADESVADVMIQPDGKIMVVGRSYNNGTHKASFGTIRLLSNGILDECYGNFGKLLVDFPSTNEDHANAVAIQSDGKILVAGVTDGDFAIIRYIPPTPTKWYYDNDGDGYGTDSRTVMFCNRPNPVIVLVDPFCPDIFNTCPKRSVEWAYYGGDCDDDNAATHPNAVETCDGKDNDCDGQIDEGLPTKTWYTDADHDGYGANATAHVGCMAPPGTGWILVGGDCDDANAGVHPGATEICDGIDNNCNGVIDEGCSGKPTISINDVTVYESQGMAVLTLKMSFITTLQLKITYATSDGTAVSNKKDKDYKAVGSTVVTIPPGTLTTTISIPVYADNLVENSEFFYVGLSKPTNCILGDVTGVVTILDGAPLVAAAKGPLVTPEIKTLKVPNAEAMFDANVYPNPSTTSFTLKVEGTDEIPVDVTIVNVTGQVMKRIRATTNIIQLGNELKPGLYLLKVQQGINSKTLKLIKN